MELNSIRPHFLRRARADRALAPTAPAHHQPFLAVYPMELLAAHHMASRDNPVISLEEAHWRLSAHPAMCTGFRNRGTLVEGAAAEIVVYDLERLKVMPMKIAHDFPGNEWRVARFEFTSLPHPEHRTQKGKWPTPRISPNV